jgi:hypothetical protein
MFEVRDRLAGTTTEVAIADAPQRVLALARGVA